jgi:hypothetical protein
MQLQDQGWYQILIAHYETREIDGIINSKGYVWIE